MEFYANEIVQDLAHRPYVELGVHSDSDSELANVYSGLETIVEETSGGWCSSYCVVRTRVGGVALTVVQW